MNGSRSPIEVAATVTPGAQTQFHYAVTCEQAIITLGHFIAHLFPGFADYQDAIVAEEPVPYHSLLSTYG